MSNVRIDVIIEDWQRDAAKQVGLNISEFVRNALSQYFSSDISIKQKEAEIEKDKALLRAKEAAIQRIKDQAAKAVSDKQLESERQRWLETHPKVFEKYQKGSISTKGWQWICKELKFNNKKQAEELLQRELIS